MILLADLKPNEKNPRKITKAALEKLKADIEDFPDMLSVRGLAVDKDNVIRGGNQRYRALIELGYKEIPDEWVQKAEDFTPEQWRKFVILDNKEAGSWDDEVLAEEYTMEELDAWDLAPEETVDDSVKGELEFAEELMLEHNYVVLYFDNPMDWQVAVDKLGLKDVKSAIKTVKSQKVGIGRVIQGAPVINRL